MAHCEKGNILRWKLKWSLLRNCISMCECNSQGYTFLFSVQFANTVFWKSAMGYFWTQWTLLFKGNMLRWKLERSVLRNFLVMCEFFSQRYTYVSCICPLSLFWRNQRKAYLDRNEAYADKENIISSKRERSFLRNFFVICEFPSQSYSIVLRKHFDNPLFVDSAKGDLGAHRGPLWNRKYLQIRTREKLTERLLSDEWLHHTEFHT